MLSTIYVNELRRQDNGSSDVIHNTVTELLLKITYVPIERYPNPLYEVLHFVALQFFRALQHYYVTSGLAL